MQMTLAKLLSLFLRAQEIALAKSKISLLVIDFSVTLSLIIITVLLCIDHSLV